MQDHDQHDQDNAHDPFTLLGGPPLFALEQEQPAEVQLVDEAVLTASSCDKQDEQSSESKCSSGDELIEILSGVEKQIERLRGLHLTHEKKLNSIAQRSRALEEAETSFDSENSSLKQREQLLEDKANELQTQQQQFTDQQTELEQKQESLKQDQTQLTRDLAKAKNEQESLNQQQEQIEQREQALKVDENQQQEKQDGLSNQLEEFNQEKENLCNEREDLGKQLDEFNKEKEDFCNERDAQQALRLENEEQSILFQDREVEFQQKQIELDQKQQSHTAQLREFEQDRESFLSQKESFELKQAELQKLHSEYEAQQKDHRQQIENTAKSSSDLEEQNRSLTDELTERDRTIDELTHRFDEQDTQSQQRINALMAESELLEEKLKEQKSQVLQGEQEASTIKQQQEQLTQLKSELANLKINSDPELMQRKDERIEELVLSLHQARGQIGCEQSIDESQTKDEQLFAENEQLRFQLERSSIDATNDNQPLEVLAEEVSTNAPADDSDSGEENFQPLQAQANQLHHQADEHDNLNKNDELEKISNAQPPIASHEIDIVVADGQAKIENADELPYPNLQTSSKKKKKASSRKNLQNKSGSAKTIVTLGLLTVASVIIAGASWFAANHYFPAKVSASITFKTDSKSNSTLTNGQLQQWQQWHRNLLTSVNFTNTLSNRLADRRLDQYADANVLRARLAEDLRADWEQPGIMTLTLAGTNKNELAAILDTLATTFISESDESLKGGREGLKTIAVGSRKHGDQVLYASLNPIPILDERLKYALYMFGAGFFGVLVLVSIIRRRPVRPTDIFADNDPVFVTPQR